MLTVDKLKVGDLIRREHHSGSYIIRRVTSVEPDSVVAVVVEATGVFNGADHSRSFTKPLLEYYTLLPGMPYITSSLNYITDNNLSDEDKKVIKEALNGCS